MFPALRGRHCLRVNVLETKKKTQIIPEYHRIVFEAFLVFLHEKRSRKSVSTKWRTKNRRISETRSRVHDTLAPFFPSYININRSTYKKIAFCPRRCPIFSLFTSVISHLIYLERSGAFRAPGFWPLKYLFGYYFYVRVLRNVRPFFFPSLFNESTTYALINFLY